MIHANAHSLSAVELEHARPAPYLFHRRFGRASARRIAEAAWAFYPPAALLVAALLLAAGCRSGSDGGSARADFRDGAALKASDVPAIYPSYPSHLPLAGTADARATAHYGKNRIEIANLSDQPWPASRIWVNRKYSALLAHTRPGQVRSFNFEYLLDDQGRPFPTDNMGVRVEEVELVTGDERTKVPFGLGY